MDNKKIIKTLSILMTLLVAVPAHALTLNGFTDFASSLQINARSQGIVKSISAKPGQRISQGDELIRLDGVSQQANLSRATAIAKSLLPVVETAQLELERALELYDRDSLSQVELKNAENKLAQAEGQYQAAQADVRRAEYQLQNTVIRSPIDGRVLQLHVNEGQYLDPAVDDSSLITLIDSRSMKALALVNSEQWAPELLGKPSVVKFRNRNYTGKVSYIGYKRIKQPSGTSAYEIHIKFNTDTLIPADMPVSITINE